MKKVRELPRGDYRKPKLYVDDLEDIINIFERTCNDIEISCGDYKYDSLDELLEHRDGSIDSLTIYGQRPYLYLSISKTYNNLSANREYPEATTAFYEIDAIMRACERPKNFLDKISWVFWILAIPMLWIMYRPVLEGTPRQWWLYYVLPVFFVWSLYVAWERSYVNTIILLNRKDEVKSFFQRNKDSLMGNLIVGVVVAVLSIGGTLFVQKVSEQPKDTSEAITAPTATSNATSPDRDK